MLLRQTTFFLLIGLALSACTGHNDEVSRHGKAAITRDYGYVIGDIVPVDYRFDLKGDEIDITSLPPVGPLNEWLNIRGYHVEHHPTGMALKRASISIIRFSRGSRNPNF